jgi:hypothetical protein
LSADKQLCYQHNNTNDYVYESFLLEEAEQFFNKRVKEILKVCISQLAEVFLSASKSSQLITKPYLDSETVSSFNHTNGNLDTHSTS